MTVKSGISGLRGTVGPGEESLTAIVVVQWVQAFVARLQQGGAPHPLVALGHDARRSSPAIAALARGALLAAGASVLDLGLTLTPTVQLAVRRDSRVAGGIMITASHNPVIWNGLKFLDGQGFFIPPDWWEAMRATIHAAALPAVPLDQIGHLEEGGEKAWQAHLQAALAVLPVEIIRQRRYRVALDACNGGASRWVELLAALGCETVLLHSEQHGFFAREAEPLPAHLGALCHLVRVAGCDIGLAADPDGDRLVLVDHEGNAVSEEHTVVLAAMAVTRRKGDGVAVNVVTTHALEEALPHARIVRVAVGEMNVVRATMAEQAVLGGEGSGGIIVPTINMARDGLAAAGLILALMAERGATLQELVAAIPHWQTVKSKVVATEGSPDTLRPLLARWQEGRPEVQLDRQSLRVTGEAGSLYLSLQDGRLELVASFPERDLSLRASGAGGSLGALFAALAEEADPVLDLTDGVKLSGGGAWLSLRPSNTEPIVRVMGELKTRSRG